MKKIFFFISILLIGCSNQNDPIREDLSPIPPELIGKWKITGVYESESGINPTWRTYYSGNEYHVWFKSNYEYENTDGDSTCLTGTYSILGNNMLKYNSSCGGEQEVYIELLSLDSLIIDLKIFEPHKLKYIKISSEGE